MLRYDILDVFSDRPFAGNQLAAVHAGGDLSSEQCLAQAREFNLSETTFPGAADRGRHLHVAGSAQRVASGEIREPDGASARRSVES